jgi:hypothetical protein
MNNEKITVPEEIPNDETVLVTAIFKDSGTFIEAGEIILEVETSKTAYEIEAKISGILTHHLSIGDEVRSGDTLCEIVEDYD